MERVKTVHITIMKRKTLLRLFIRNIGRRWSRWTRNRKGLREGIKSILSIHRRIESMDSKRPFTRPNYIEKL